MPAAAMARLAGRVTRTPVFRSSTLDQLVGGGREVLCKAESLQRTGSFKFRGALNALLRMPPHELAARGVVTHSSGNHGQGLAAAAQLVGAPCTVVVPHTCPQVKVDAMRDTYGAEVLFCEPTQQARNGTVAEVAARTGAAVVPPYNHPDVIAGQGTLALELLEQAGDGGLDAVIVPTSGGGMLAGVALALADKGVKVFAVEPRGKRLGDALRAQQRVVSPADADRALDTICDAIQTMPIGDVPWPIVKDLVEPAVLTVTDEQVVGAMHFVYSRMKLVVEPAAATGVAALLDGQATRMGDDVRRVGVVLCGGNVDMERWVPQLRQWGSPHGGGEPL